MGIKKMITRAAEKAANTVSNLSVLSLNQIEEIEIARQEYLSQVSSPNDTVSQELTERLLAMIGVQIYEAYLPQLKELYLPIDHEAEYQTMPFLANYNIRYINITKWVVDKKENSLEKLVNVYQVLSNEECNIALVFNRTMSGTNVYLAVTNVQNAKDNIMADQFIERLTDAIRGNFPGAEWVEHVGKGYLPCIKEDRNYSVAAVSNVPTEKSEKFVSQTIEKLLDGILPDDNYKKEYTLILLATPIMDVASRKLELTDYYTSLAPYASWQTGYTLTQSDARTATATMGVNVGASAGIQNTNSQSLTDSQAKTDNENEMVTDTKGEAEAHGDSDSKSKSLQSSETETSQKGNNFNTNHAESKSENYTKTNTAGEEMSSSETASVDAGINIANIINAGGGLSYTTSQGKSTSEAISEAIGKATTDSVTSGHSSSYAKSIMEGIVETTGKTVSDTITKTASQAISKTLGHAVTNTVAKTSGVAKGMSLGANFGANFARSSSVTATIGLNESITQSYTNFNIKHTLEVLEHQMKRFEKASALGMWDFAAYVLCEEESVANNVAHSYLALTQGEESYVAQASINIWRGDTHESDDAKEICKYLRELRHPLFGLNPNRIIEDAHKIVYYPVVNPAIALSGKELAYSLNFPQKSVSGLPVIECAEFGRGVYTYSGGTP